MTKDQFQENVQEPAGSATPAEPLLSRAECNLMRGLAIIFIITNNFTHLLKGVFTDNEYQYNWQYVEGFLNNLSHPDGILPFNLLSFYCPYGVMLFIFLSGYGLVLKYEKGNGQGVSRRRFIFSHYDKMFTMQLKGLALFLMVGLLSHPRYIVDAKDMLLQVLLLGNLNPHGDILPGPYWFFGMIIEMYVIYRLLICQRKDMVMWIMVALSLIAMALVPPTSLAMKYLRINCFLAILPFCMGVFAARHLHVGSFSLHKGSACLGWFVLSFILLTVCKFNFYSWLIMPLFIVSTAVTIVKLMSRVKLLDNIFSWLGALSGVLFVVHPSVRILLLGRANMCGDFYGMTFIYLFVTIGLSMMLKPAFSAKKKELPKKEDQ